MDDEEELKRAAVENISKSQRTFKYPMKDNEDENGKVCLYFRLKQTGGWWFHACNLGTGTVYHLQAWLMNLQVVVVDVRALGRKSGNAYRKLVVDRALPTKDQDNAAFYSSLRGRMQR